MIQEIMQFAGRHQYLSIAWIVLLAALVYTIFKQMTSKVKVITRTEATRLINQEQGVVVDTRLRDEFRKGHIVNAINILPGEIKNGHFAELEKHKSLPVIIVDVNGTGGQDSAALLVKAGFERVYHLKEGIAGWLGEHLPLVRNK